MLNKQQLVAWSTCLFIYFFIFLLDFQIIENWLRAHPQLAFYIQVHSQGFANHPQILWSCPFWRSTGMRKQWFVDIWHADLTQAIRNYTFWTKCLLSPSLCTVISESDPSHDVYCDHPVSNEVKDTNVSVGALWDKKWTESLFKN